MTSAKATASSSEEEYADEDELSGISLDDALKGGRRKNGKSKTKKNKRNKKSRKQRKQRKTRKQTK
jgi:hypothetical protein